MTALLLAPHQDDETLWAAFTCIRHRPHIVTVLRSVNQERLGITAAEREAEAAAAAAILGCTWEQWSEPDDAPDWTAVERMLRLVDESDHYARVFAPWPEEPGTHPQHARIGELAEAVFGAERVSFYCTYRVGGEKTRGRQVEYERPWIETKLRALACYRSQIERGPARFWMMDQYEYEPWPVTPA